MGVKKRPSVTLTFLLLAVVLQFGCTTAALDYPGARPTGPQPRAERPTYSLGDRWIRSDGIFEVVRVECDTYVFAAGPQEEIHLSKDLVLVKALSYGERWEFSPPPPIDWPLEVGKRGSAHGTLHAGRGQGGAARMEWAVVSYEEVEVPAGKFKAFALDFSITTGLTTDFGRGAGSTRGRTWSYRAWYAPEVRQIVRTDSVDTSSVRFRVVAVDPAETAPLAIVLREPEDHQDTSERYPSLVGTVSGGKGVARVTISLNGAELRREEAKGEPKRALILDTPLSLRSGRNVILVTAVDPAGTMTQAARTVNFTPPPRVDLEKEARQRVDRARVLLHGTLRHPEGLTHYEVYVNDGRQWADFVWGSNAKEKPIEVPLTLSPGENIVQVKMCGLSCGVVERIVVLEESAVVAKAEPAMPEVPLAAASPSPAAAQALPTPDQTPSSAPAGIPPSPSPSSSVAAPGSPGGRPALPSPPAVPPAVASLPPPSGGPAAARPASPATIATGLAPLRLALSSPLDHMRVEQEVVALAGLVSGGKGVTRLVVTLNGSEISKREEQTPVSSAAVNLPLRLREGQNTVVVTVTEAEGALLQEVRTVHYEKLVPLTVTFRYPQDEAQVTEPGSVAAAVVTSSRGVARVSVTLNGVEVHQQAERAPQTSVLVTVPLTLREGVNTLGLTATDGGGMVRQEVRTVTLARAVAAVPPVSTPPPSPARDRWAVVIGVGRYDNPSIPSLKYTVNDAEAMYETLIGPAGFRKEHVLLLTDRTERKPTLRNIKWALGTFLARSAKKDDTVLIYFAGHGAPEVDPRGIERDGLAKYLVPGDADPDDLFSSALPMDDVQTIFQRIEAERVVAFLDSCYSGAAGGRTFLARRTRTGSLDDQFLERLTRSKGRVIVTASRSAEVSLELAELGHGVFTYYLVEGLRGRADGNGDGIVTLQELYEYVEQQVVAKSRAVGGNQHPVMRGELEGVFPMTKVGK